MASGEHIAQDPRFGLFQDFDFAGILKTQNRPREYSMYLRESNVRSHKLDVEETNFSFTQFF